MVVGPIDTYTAADTGRDCTNNTPNYRLNCTLNFKRKFCISVLEYVGPNWRTFVANMSIAVFFSLAESLLPWIAYYVSHWQWLCFVTSLPLLAGVFIAWIVPESAR